LGLRLDSALRLSVFGGCTLGRLDDLRLARFGLLFGGLGLTDLNGMGYGRLNLGLMDLNLTSLTLTSLNLMGLSFKSLGLTRTRLSSARRA
jgi:hypothetical protein